MPRSLRVLPPGGGFAGPLRVYQNFLAHWKEGDDESALAWFAESVKDYFPGRDGYFYSSGKKGLLALADYLREDSSQPVVSLSAYSCPDLIACLAEKNFKFRFFDIDARTLEPVLEDEHLSADLVLLSNLFGLVDPYPSNTSEKSIVLDDGCQGALSRSAENRIGSRANSFGLLSFGRGKALPGLGGGALLVPEATSEKFEQGRSSGKPLVNDMFKSFVFWLLQSPWFYRLPSSIPSLGLGQTHYLENVDTGLFSIGQVIVATSQLLHIESRAEMHAENSRKWTEALSGVELVQPLVERGGANIELEAPIRYPILVPGGVEMRDKLYQELTMAGLGASCSYPGVLPSYPQILDKVLSVADRGASEVAETILTLPVHRNVKDRDIDRTLEVIKKVI